MIVFSEPEDEERRDDEQETAAEDKEAEAKGHHDGHFSMYFSSIEGHTVSLSLSL